MSYNLEQNEYVTKQVQKRSNASLFDLNIIYYKFSYNILTNLLL